MKMYKIIWQDSKFGRDLRPSKILSKGLYMLSPIFLYLGNKNMTFFNLTWFSLFSGVWEPGMQNCSFWFISRWKSAKGFRWRASEVLWESSGVEISHCTSNWLFHRHREVENSKSSPPHPALLRDLRNLSTQTRCSSCWCQIGHKGAPKCHRFCPGTFLHMQIPINRAGQETGLQEHSSKLTWQRHYHGGWNHKTLPTVCVCPSVHLGASLKVLPHGGWSAILNFFLFFSSPFN